MGLGELGAVGRGITEGMREGITNYSNIQTGIVQKAQADEAMAKQKLMSEPINLKQHPLYTNASPQGKAYFDSILPQDGITNRRYLGQLVADEDVKTKLGSYAKESAIRIAEPQVMQLGEELKAAKEFASLHPNDIAAQNKADELHTKYNEAHAKIIVAKGDTEKQFRSIAMTDAIKENADVFNKSPIMKSLAKYFIESDDVEGVKDLLKTAAKMKTPQMTNEWEGHVAKGVEQGWSPTKISNEWNKIMQARQVAKAQAVETSKPVATENYVLTTLDGKKLPTVALVRGNDGKLHDTLTGEVIDSKNYKSITKVGTNVKAAKASIFGLTDADGSASGGSIINPKDFNPK